MAKSEGATFLDLNEIAARHYEEDGKAKVETTYFTRTDHTHTTESGARLNARSVVEGLRATAKGPIVDALKTAPASQ